MKEKYRIIHLFASFVIEIACVYGKYNERNLYGLQYTLAEHNPTPPPEPRPNQFCSCGQENKLEGERIMGGKTVDPPNRYPFVVALVMEYEIFCSGTLISRLYVLTSESCIDTRLEYQVRVALGAHNKGTSPNPVPVSKFIVYQGSNSFDYRYNIALIRLNSPIQLTKTVGLACLPLYPQFASPRDLATVTGWGYINKKYEFSMELQEVQVTVMPKHLCFVSFSKRIPPETIFCASGLKGKGKCEGDTGGPLFVKYDEQWFTIGVASYRGIGCEERRLPDAYSRVSEYLGWIRNNTKDSPPCDVKGKSPPLETNLENCGIPNKRDEEKIAGVTEAAPFEFPWIARIVYNQSFAGLGSLVSPKYVLTVASIFDTWYRENILETDFVDVFMGRHRISVVEPTFRKFDVEEVIRYPYSFINTPFDNPAILKLKVPATTLPDIYRPICLPRMDALYSPGLKLKTAGWRRISKSGPVSDVLLKGDMYVQPKELCRQIHNRWFAEGAICAYENGTDTCEGDKGAPLMMLYNGSYYLTGMSSWGSNNDCATPGEPRIFSAVYPNIVWINTVTGLTVE